MPGAGKLVRHRLAAADPFDPQAFSGGLTAPRAVLAGRAAPGDALFVARVAAMAPAERRAFADRLEARLGRVFGWER